MEQEVKKIITWVKEYVENSNAKGVVIGNSGGKDCALVGILCKAACENTVGIILPCSSKRNLKQNSHLGLLNITYKQCLTSLLGIKKSASHKINY